MAVPAAAGGRLVVLDGCTLLMVAGRLGNGSMVSSGQRLAFFVFSIGVLLWKGPGQARRGGSNTKDQYNTLSL
jgi:hypothetical protein